MSLSLKEYQEAGVNFCLEAFSRPAGVDRTAWLGDDPGLGKTVMGAVLLRRALERSLASRVIVMAPAGLLRVWRKELKRWAPELRTFLPSSSLQVRAPEEGEILILSYDAFASLVTTQYDDTATEQRRLAALAALQNMPRHTLLCADEMHYIRGKASNRSLCFEHLRERVHTRRGACVGLSASLMPNTPLDLWIAAQRFGIQHKIFPGGISQFATHFGGFYEKRTRRWHFAKRPPGGSILPLLNASGLVLRRTSEEVGNELPPARYTVTKCALPEDLVNLSRGLIAEALTGHRSADFRLEIADETIDLPDVEGRIDFGELSHLREQSAVAKIPTMLRRIAELEAEREGDPIVVYSEHREPIEQLRSRPGWAVITGKESKTQRDTIVERFQLGELLGVGLTSAGREGITLTRSNYLLRVSTSWSAENEKQVAGRVVRLGQQACEVIVETIVAEDPIEQMVYRKLAEKQVRGLKTWAI